MLDGIRGWAALQVVVFHMLWECFHLILPELHTTSIMLILNGNIAVYTFFVLSGCVLSYGYVTSRDAAVVRKLAVMRYLRLVVPISISSALTLVLVSTDLTANRAAAEIVHSQFWLGAFLADGVSFAAYLQFVTVDVFSFQISRGSLNPFLWTMSIEIFGSFVVFFTLLLGHGAGSSARIFLIVVSAAVIALIDVRAIGFPVGVVLAEAIAAGGFLEIRRHTKLSWVVVAVGVLIAIEILQNFNGPVEVTIAALCLLVAVLSNSILSRIFEAPFSQWLGRISFPLYLGQFAILVSLTSWLIVIWIEPTSPGHVAPYVIAVASVLASLLVAIVLREAERRTGWLNTALAGWLLHPRTAR